MVATSVVLFAVGVSPVVLGQTETTGAIRGVVNNRDTGKPEVGATVVATSSALQGPRSDLTDESGAYALGDLPPGIYRIAVYWNQRSLERDGIIVSLGQTRRIDFTTDDSGVGSEVINVRGHIPIVDQGSTKTGMTVTTDYMRNVPSGRTWTDQLGAAAGTQGDLYGTSFFGSTSPENIYLVNGLNTNRLQFGFPATDLPNEFVAEMEVISGGYQAEYGRSTGALVNVITKTGSNEFHGQIQGSFESTALTARARAVDQEGSALSVEDRTNYDIEAGFEIGGPIVRDKLWFHVGLMPRWVSTHFDRIVSRRIDKNNDGEPDLDPDTGFEQLEEVARTTRKSRVGFYNFTGALSYTLDPEHQGTVTVFGRPGIGNGFRGFSGDERSTRMNQTAGTVDTTARWSSRFAGNRTRLDAQLGLMNEFNRLRPALPGGDEGLVIYEYGRDLYDFEPVEGCNDNAPDDPYPMIANCPVVGYRLGGVGNYGNGGGRRTAGAVTLTQRVRAAGRHMIKIGADVENNATDNAFEIGGDRLVHHLGDIGFGRNMSLGIEDLVVTPDGDEPCGPDNDGDGVPDSRCESRDRDLHVRTTTRNVAAFVQDSWSPVPNLTFNAGIRWERQSLGTAEHTRGTISATSGERVGEVGAVLSNLWAPRLGVIYDWTREGRSKSYAHVGRYYESMMSNISAGFFSGTLTRFAVFPTEDCENPDEGESCSYDNSLITIEQGSDVLVAPNLRAQYMDELVAGVDYELLADFKVGAAYVHRSIGRAVEDLSVDGGNLLVIGNPGEFDEDAVRRLRDDAADARTAGDDARANSLERQADTFEGISRFDRPVRRYDGLQLTANRRFTRTFAMWASYTYSQTRGNYFGLFSPDSGQPSPNATSQYDLVDTLSNRYGDLPHDRRHLLKLDGYYLVDRFPSVGSFVIGGRFRLSSGRPRNARGSHLTYGPGETFLLPRGSAGRTPAVVGTDLHVAYRRALSRDTVLEVYAEVFNLFNQQTVTDVNEEYTRNNVNPILDGDAEDLRHAKRIDFTGVTSAQVVERSTDWLEPSGFQDPLSVRLGARFLF